MYREETSVEGVGPDRSEEHRDRIVEGSPVFYGWIIAVVGALGLIMTSPGQTYSVSIFIEHFIRDLDITRSLVSSLYTGGTLFGALALPSIGRLIDRRGARLMLPVITILFGLACMYMSIVRSAIMLGIGFLGVRMLGQGSLQLVCKNVMNRWWVRRRGLIIGASGLVMSLVGMGAFPNFINWAIPRYGWRTTYVIMGGMLLLIMTPLGLIFVRQRPEDHGLRPDGGRDEGTPGGEGEHLEENWTLQEAMRTPAFWIVTGAVGISALVSTGLYFHTVSIFEDNGLSADTAALAFVPIALTGALSRLVSGYLTDNMPVRFLLAASLFFLVLTLNMVRFLNPQLAYLYGIVHGVKGGIITTVSGVVWANYFGRKHLGSISGVARLAGTIGSALGPMPFGIIRDVMGSYNSVLTIVTIPTLVLTVACFFVHKPQKS